MTPLTSLILAAAGHGAPVHEPGNNTHAVTEVPTFLDPIIGGMLWVGLVVLVVGVCLCLYRVVRGPHLSDRVLAADALGLQVVGIVLVLAIETRIDAFFDTALTVAIIGFASTVAFGQYIGARANSPDAEADRESSVTS